MQENLITQILREKREGIGSIEAIGARGVGENAYEVAKVEGTPNPWKITHYSFGEITVDGEKFTHDVIVGWDKAQPIKKWTRKEWHFVYPYDLKDVVVLDPHIVVFGTGASGMLRVGKEAEEMILERYVGVRKERSDIAVKTFNELIEEGKHAVLAIHVTC